MILKIWPPKSALKIVVLALLPFTVLTSSVQAACTAAFSGAVSSLPDNDYDPFLATEDITTYSFTIENTSAENCDFAVSLHRNPALNPEFTSGLSYNFDTVSLFTPVQNPPSLVGTILSSTLLPNETEQLQFQINIPAGQVVAKSSYNDDVLLRIYDATGGIIGSALASKTVTMTTNVASGCTLPTPDVTALDFSGNITNGLSDEITKRVTFSNVKCTEATKIKLTGNVMNPTVPVGARSGFDNFMNYQAVATMDSASVTLTTNESAAEETATSAGQSDGFTTTGTVTVDIKMLRGQPLLPGVYTGSLTIVVDPNP